MMGGGGGLVSIEMAYPPQTFLKITSPEIAFPAISHNNFV